MCIVAIAETTKKNPSFTLSLWFHSTRLQGLLTSITDLYQAGFYVCIDRDLYFECSLLKSQFQIHLK